MNGSILTSIKKVLGIPEEHTDFDPDIMMYINSVFTDLQDIGVGPVGGFSIEDATATWDTFLGADPRLNSAKSYIGLKVRMLFDPPQTSFLLNAMQEQIRETEWRLNVRMEETNWTDPDPDSLSTTTPLLVAQPATDEPDNPTTGTIWVKY